LTPYDLGYGPFVKFDHDFIGREALEQIAENPGRTKITLAWSGADVTEAFGTLFGDNESAKFMHFPLANYATLPYDKVLKDGKVIGLSTYTGYSANERSVLSLGIVDNEYSQPGTEVTLIWGEEGGGSSKVTVERHVQREIRATVGPAPYATVARDAYRPK
jgi:vanillate/3-O-methylgallate O-demethylase